MKITLENCGKSFNRKWLFRNLNCEFHAGEIWAFLGSNGSGKSTLSLILAGQVWPTEGKITWANPQNIEATKIFQFVSLASPAMELPEEFNLVELVSMHGKMKPFRTKNAIEEIAELCKFGQNILEKPIINYSSGMKQRAKLCLAALSETPLLILDEPLTNLDKAGEELFEKIMQNYTQNRLVIVASNRDDEIIFCEKKLQILSDQVVVLNY